MCNPHMARFLCPSCHEVVESGSLRVAFCGACGTPVTTEDLLPVQPITLGREQHDLATVPEVPS
jgi:hypothetical protein